MLGFLAWWSNRIGSARPDLKRGSAIADVGATVAVKRIGEKLMNEYVLPLEVVGLLLTAALIGAVIIAMHEKGK